jgi:hypothetical protein
MGDSHYLFTGSIKKSMSAAMIETTHLRRPGVSLYRRRVALGTVPVYGDASSALHFNTK